MFEKELRSAIAHFDHLRATRIIEKICAAELRNRYEVSDSEDALYWQLDAMIIEAENSMYEKPKVNGSGIWVEAW